MMHEKAAARYILAIQAAPDPKTRDHYLDQYADSLLRATEWDAERWGFDPDRWMEKERAAMLKSAGGQTHPREMT